MDRLASHFSVYLLSVFTTICQSVCLLITLLQVILAVHLSLSLCVFLCLPGGPSVLPPSLSACLSTLLFSIPPCLHAWSWVHSSPKATLLGPELGLAAPSEAEQVVSEPGPPPPSCSAPAQPLSLRGTASPLVQQPPPLSSPKVLQKDLSEGIWGRLGSN